MKTDSLESLCRQQSELIDELISKNRILEERSKFWRDQYDLVRKNFSWNAKYSMWIKDLCDGDSWKIPKAQRIPLELVFDLPILN
jgi:hypothetical protein